MTTPNEELDEVKSASVETRGFQDRSGVLPRSDYIGQPDVNVRARGSAIEEKDTSGTRTARTVSSDAQVIKPSLKEPDIPGQSQYPFNDAYETRGGHLFEIDDTPGHERYNVKHKSGTKFEMRPDGSYFRKVVGKDYEVLLGDKEMIVRGNVNIVVESDANIRVEGDCNQQIDGDHNVLVQGNQTIEVQGDQTIRVHGDRELTTTGTMLRQTRGSVTERNLSNYIQRTVGTHTEEIGAAWKLTTQSTATMVSLDEIQASFAGGFLTMNGKNEDGDEQQGEIEAYEYYGTDYNGVNYYASGDIHVEVDLHVDGDIHGDNIYASNVEASTFEGTATKATYAVTAGAAPTGSASPTTPNPTGATAATEGDDAPNSEEIAADVTGTSTDLITAIDRKPLSEHNRRILNTYEFTSKARNKNLRYNNTWVQDAVDAGSINTSIQSSTPPSSSRSATPSTIQSGLRKIGNVLLPSNMFKLEKKDRLYITKIPDNYILPSELKRGTPLSPNFKISHMLAGDSDGGQFIEQLGLSKAQIAQNLQLLAYNVLEPLKDKYKDKWTVSEGIYNLLPDETLDPSSINKPFGEGLAVGIQFADHPNSFYFDAAVWMMNNLVFDKLILSYIDYDPNDVNEPTLIVSIKDGYNSRSIITEFNHEETSSSSLEDLSSD